MVVVHILDDGFQLFEVVGFARQHVGAYNKLCRLAHGVEMVSAPFMGGKHRVAVRCQNGCEVLSNDFLAVGSFVTVDVASSNMLGDRLQLSVDLAIDHHESNSRFANNLLLDSSASACGEIILKVIKELCGSVSKEEADLLYIALSTDTGCFQYGNTNAASFRAAAELCDLKADVAKLNQLFFRTFSRGRIALEGAIMSSLRSYADGRITMAVITHKMVEEAGASDDDMEDLASLPGKVAGTLVSVMVKENDRGFSKLSLRSTGEVNVSEICAKFGGGGHAMASGCELDLVPDEAAEVIRAAIEEKLP